MYYYLLPLLPSLFPENDLLFAGNFHIVFKTRIIGRSRSRWTSLCIVGLRNLLQKLSNTFHCLRLDNKYQIEFRKLPSSLVF